MEDRKKFVSSLKDTLKISRAYSDIESMELTKDGKNIEIRFTHGLEMSVYVDGDSCVGILVDVLKALKAI